MGLLGGFLGRLIRSIAPRTIVQGHGWHQRALMNKAARKMNNDHFSEAAVAVRVAANPQEFGASSRGLIFASVR
jgi:hypothetical protein